jgi:type II secretory pathway component PulJ
MKHNHSRRNGFTLMEATLVSGLMAALAVTVSAVWVGVGRPARAVVARSRVFQEMDLAVAALVRDTSGGLGNPDGRLGRKSQGRWVGWMQPAEGQLWLCFDGGSNPNSAPDWGSPDTVIVYRREGDALVRWDRTENTTFTVARNLESLTIAAVDDSTFRITLDFRYRGLAKSCTLIARVP